MRPVESIIAANFYPKYFSHQISTCRPQSTRKPLIRPVVDFCEYFSPLYFSRFLFSFFVKFHPANSSKFCEHFLFKYFFLNSAIFLFFRQISPRELESLIDHVTFSPGGVVFLKPSIRKGILPTMLKEILDTRFVPELKQNLEFHTTGSVFPKLK